MQQVNLGDKLDVHIFNTKLEATKFQLNEKLLEASRIDLNLKLDNLQKNLTALNSNLRSDIGRVFESAKKSDLSGTGLHSLSFMQSVTVLSIMDLVALLPSLEYAGILPGMSTGPEQYKCASSLAQKMMALFIFFKSHEGNQHYHDHLRQP